MIIFEIRTYTLLGILNPYFFKQFSFAIVMSQINLLMRNEILA